MESVESDTNVISDVTEPADGNGQILIEEKLQAHRDEKNGENGVSHQHKKRLRIILAVIAAIVFLGGGIYYLYFIAPYESTDNAFIEGHVTPVAPQVSGRVVNLQVQDNQEVKRGDILLEIDPRDYETKLQQAKSNLTAAKSRFEQAKAQFAVDQAKVQQEQANITAADAEATRAGADLRRYQAVESRAVSKSQIDLAVSQAGIAAAQVDVARSRELASQAQANLSKTSIDTALADVQQNEAILRQAELNFSYTKIYAPEDGKVTRRAVERGAYVQTGQPLMAIVPRDVWIVANFKETQLTYMRVGQPVKIKVDAYPKHTFNGHVESIQSGSGARFSLFPPENATGNYIKVVQRVPVKIIFDESSISDSALALGPGMSVVPKVRIK